MTGTARCGWRRSGPSTTGGPGLRASHQAVAGPYRAWAGGQADAALLNSLAALPIRWINDPHRDRLAAHKPQQLAVAADCGLRVPRTLITNDPESAADFADQLGSAVVCKPVLGGRIDIDGDRLMVPTHVVTRAEMDERIKLTAHLFQERIPKAFEVRLTAVGGRLFAATLHAGSDQARVDWRTDYEALTYGTTRVPDQAARAVRAFLDHYGIAFGALDFAVTPGGEWVFFENNPAGTWAWVEGRTGLPIAAAHADYLQGAIE